MKNDVHAISLNFRCSRSYLSLNDKVTLYLDVANNLDVEVQNINIETFFENKYLRMIQNLFCNDNRSSIIKIDKLNPFEHIRIECCLELYCVPKDLKTSVFYTISYNLEIDGEFIKEEIKTNIINLKIYNIKISDFLINSNKKFYRIGEIIDYTISVSNIGNVIAQNLFIKNFIPKNTIFIDDSVKFEGDGELFYLEKGLLIDKINENSTAKINFKVKIDPCIPNDSIKSKAILEYRDCSQNNLEIDLKKIESNLYEVFVSSGSIFSKEGSFIHKIDKEIAYLNEIINHKITIKNKSNIKVKMCYFKEDKNKNLEYIKNTLTINGIPTNCENIYEDINLEDINLEDIIITYKTKVIDVPYDGKINLNSKIYYTLDSEYEITRELSDKCEDSSFLVYGAIIKKENFKRYHDKNSVSIGELIDCNLEIENTGNLDALNLILKENIIDEVSLVEGSFFINSNKIKDLSLNQEVLIGCIKPKEKIFIQYKLKSNTFTKGSKDFNSILKYECLLLNGDVLKQNSSSNLCSLKIEGANLSSLTKKVDKSLCKINDILTFNMNVKNKGNIEALDIKIKDIKNEYLEFLKNSLYLNNNNLKNENIYDGIWKGTLEVGEEINISYKAKVVSLPKSGFTFSKTNLNFLYLIDNKQNSKNEYIESNDVKIVIVNPDILIKDINCINDNGKFIKYSINDSEIPFKIVIKNNGTICIDEIKFSEILPNELELISSSFNLNNKVLDDNCFYNGLKIKNLECQEYIEIDFALKTKNFENIKETLKVESNVEYSFLNSLNNEIQKEIINLKEDIFIINPKLKVIKEVNKTILLEGEDLSETLILSNMGNFEINNVEIILPNYKYFSPRKDTLSIDNFMIDKFPINNKILIENLKVNEVKKIHLRYEVLNPNLNSINLPPSKVIGKVKIMDTNIIDTLNVVSNDLNISYVKSSIFLNQEVSNEIILAGDNVKYFLTIKNEGNTFYENAILNINIPKELVYIPNTLIVNNSLRNDIENFNNISIPIIKVNETIKISLMLNVFEDIEENSLNLSAKINGECFLLNKYINCSEFKSSDIYIQIEKCLAKIYRTSSISRVQIGDKILINSMISNEGSLDLKDVVFYEKENKFLNFIENSLKIDNEPLYLNESLYEGLKIGEIKKGQSITIECEYEYINGGFEGVIESYSSIDFLIINPSSSKFERLSIESNQLNIEKSMTLFKTVNINGEIEISLNDPNILEVSNLIVKPSILNYYSIQTIKNTSYDNQILTGRKVIIEGILEERIECIVNDAFSALYFIENSTPFSTFIVMPEENDYDNIVFECKIEDLYFKETSERTIFRDINFMIEGY